MKTRLFAGLLAALMAAAALGQSYTIFSPGPPGPVKSDGSYALQQEVAADIIGLWTGTCSATTFLKGAGACGQVVLTTDVTGTLPATNGGTGFASYAIGDLLTAGTTTALSRLPDVSVGSFLRSGGTGIVPSWSAVTIPNAATLGDIWYGGASNVVLALAGNTTTSQLFLSQTGNGTASAAPIWSALPGSFSGFANPTATIGPTANNGSATTAMRSDASPAICLSCTFPWTGTHLFEGPVSTQISASSVSEGTRSSLAAIELNNSGGATDAHLWEIIGASPTRLSFRALSDSTAVAGSFLDVTRSGAAITNMAFGNITDNPTYIFQGTGGVQASYLGVGRAPSAGATRIVAANGGSGDAEIVSEADTAGNPQFRALISGVTQWSFGGLRTDGSFNICNGSVITTGCSLNIQPSGGPVTVQSSTTQQLFQLIGPGVGSANAAYMGFYDHNGTRIGYTGDAGTGDSNIFLGCDVNPCGIVLANTGAGTNIIGSNTSTIALNGSTITAPNATTVPWTNCTFSTWSATPSGFSSVAAQTFKYTLCGRIVTVIVPAFTGTSNATTFTIGSVPGAIQPASAVTGHCGGLEDNGTLFLEGTAVPSGATIAFAIWQVAGTRIQENTNGWTNTGTKGLNQGCSFTYSTQ